MSESAEDRQITLHWRILQPDQIWQAAHDPYLCTVVRSLEGDSFYATIVRSGDLFVVVLEDAATLEAAQAWCSWWLGTGG